MDRPDEPNDTPRLNVDDEIKEAFDIKKHKINIIFKNIPEDNNKCDDILIQEIKLHIRSHGGVQKPLRSIHVTVCKQPFLRRYTGD